MKFKIELDREDDGRWMAEIPELPGVMAYGATQGEAEAAVEALALRVIADQIELGNIGRKTSAVEFQQFCDRVAAGAQSRGMNETALKELLAD